MLAVIISRSEAKQKGLKRYFTGKPCAHGHLCERYTSAQTCVQCVSERGKRPETVERQAKYRETNKEKIKALGVEYRHSNRARLKQKTKEHNDRRKGTPAWVAHRKAWYQKNRERINAQQRQRHRLTVESKPPKPPKPPTRPDIVLKKAMQAIGVTIYIGHRPCSKCRHSLRYAVSGKCIHCASQRVNEWHKINPSRVRTLNAGRRALKIKARLDWVDRDALRAIYDACPEGCHVDHIIPLKGKLVCGLHVPWNLQYLPASDNISKGNRFDPETYVHELPLAA